MYAFGLSCQVYFKASFCEQVTRRAQRTGSLLNEFINADVDEAVDLCVENFSLELLHQNFAIQIFGLFSVNMRHVYELVATMTGYLIILVQVQMTADY
nr:gustatory receptor 23a-like [Aedes albopictus]